MSVVYKHPVGGTLLQRPQLTKTPSLSKGQSQEPLLPEPRIQGLWQML